MDVCHVECGDDYVCMCVCIVALHIDMLETNKCATQTWIFPDSPISTVFALAIQPITHLRYDLCQLMFR